MGRPLNEKTLAASITYGLAVADTSVLTSWLLGGLLRGCSWTLVGPKLASGLTALATSFLVRWLCRR